MKRYTFSPMTRAATLFLIVLFLVLLLGTVTFVWFSTEPVNRRVGLTPHILALVIMVIWLIRSYTRMWDAVLTTPTELIYEPAKGTLVTIPIS